ncbi:helix-turn-helix transcriptional regulator [soil metagenome]
MDRPDEPRMVRVAAMVADATRARMLCFLLSGQYAAAGELARAAGVVPATASEHLSRLVDADLVVCEPRGRHRYYRLADGEVAHALEALALVAERGSHDRSWGSPARQRLRAARCCYGHIAGQLGVQLLDRLLGAGWLIRIDDRYRLTDAGAAGLTSWGLDGRDWQRRMAAAPQARWIYPCLDWSERRDHMAGKFAAALLTHFVTQGWLRRRTGERALDVTATGRAACSWLSV